MYANDAEEKKDLYQEILLQAWKGIASFRGDARFSTWLYRICLNTIFTQKRKKHRIVYRDTLEDIAPVVHHHSVQADESARLQLAITRLSEVDRAIISMHLDGYNNGEIGEMMGISNNLVSVKLHRIKQQLVQVQIAIFIVLLFSLWAVYTAYRQYQQLNSQVSAFDPVLQRTEKAPPVHLQLDENAATRGLVHLPGQCRGRFYAGWRHRLRQTSGSIHG